MTLAFRFFSIKMVEFLGSNSCGLFLPPAFDHRHQPLEPHPLAHFLALGVSSQPTCYGIGPGSHDGYLVWDQAGLCSSTQCPGCLSCFLASLGSHKAGIRCL